MNIRVNVKQLGKKKDKISGAIFYLENKPSTVRELITECVKTCVKEYNQRIDAGEMAVKPLDEQQIKDMSEVGKIAFGLNYGDKKADLNKAIDAALLAYEDGLFRIFIGMDDAGTLDDEISILDDSEVTFIRLVMLSGRLW